MSPIVAAGRFERVPGPAAAATVMFRAPGGVQADCIVVSGWSRGELPTVLVDPEFNPPRAAGGSSWSLTAAGQDLAFEARDVILLQPRVPLLEPMLSPFRLSGRERWSVRLLLRLLRLPGGARLLRAWHGRRH